MSSDHAACRRRRERRAPAAARPPHHLHLNLPKAVPVPPRSVWRPGAVGILAAAPHGPATGPAAPQAPGPGDDATIPGQYSVTSSASQSVNSLTATRFMVLGGTFAVTAQNTVSVLVQLIVANGTTLAVTGGNQPVDVIDCEIS